MLWQRDHPAEKNASFNWRMLDALTPTSAHSHSPFAQEIKAGIAVTSYGTNGNVIQTYTVPTSGTYGISASGAQGGGDPTYGLQGGLGASVAGDIFLQGGAILEIVVATEGSNAQPSLGGAPFGGGGGGGSFIIETFDGSAAVDIILAVAGGGGGGGPYVGGGSAGTGPTGGRGEGNRVAPVVRRVMPAPAAIVAAGVAAALPAAAAPADPTTATPDPRAAHPLTGAAVSAVGAAAGLAAAVVAASSAVVEAAGMAAAAAAAVATATAAGAAAAVPISRRRFPTRLPTVPRAAATVLLR